MNTNILDQYAESYDDSFKYNDENILMLKEYCNIVVKSFERFNNPNIISLGIGHRVVTSYIVEYLSINSNVNYTIIEGSQDIINNFKKETNLSDQITIVNDFFEHFSCNTLFDIIEMGFILEHVDDPKTVLKRFKKYLAPKGILHIAVPNARSIHRLLGYHSGILQDLHALSNHDKLLGHQRYFSLDTITDLVIGCDLEITNTKGLYLKPFTSTQINALDLSQEVLGALIKVGLDLPAISNAIYLETKHR